MSSSLPGAPSGGQGVANPFAPSNNKSTSSSTPQPAPASGAGGGAATAAKAAAAAASPASTKTSASTSKGASSTTAGSTTTAPTKKKARRKKPAKSSGGSGGGSSGGPNSSTSIIAAARAAKQGLEAMAAREKALGTDPIWVPTQQQQQDQSNNVGMIAMGSFVSKTLGSMVTPPEHILNKALANNGMKEQDVTPQALACLLEQARRIAVELVVDAQDYATHANRSDGNISSADLLLAADMRQDKTLQDCLPTVVELASVAQSVNRVPLPAIPANHYGYAASVLAIPAPATKSQITQLPPPDHLLTARTFDVVVSAQVAQRMGQGGVPPSSTNPTGQSGPEKTKSKKKKGGTTAGYGANRGRQIPIHLKNSTNPAATTAASGSDATANTGTPGATPATAASASATNAATQGTVPMDTTPSVQPPPQETHAGMKRSSDQIS